MEDNYHVPVLPKEVIDSLNLKPNTIVVDGTLGGAGHTSLILKTNSSIKVIGVDRDTEALEYSRKRLGKDAKRVTFIHSNYKRLPEVLEELKIKVDGVLLDLGVSSHQIDEAGRGFSFKKDASLDMRMDKTQEFCAKDVVNDYSEEDLVKIFSSYGEEKFSKRIAKGIVNNRPIQTTFELVNTIKGVVDKINPKESASSVQRVFQAIRIEVNDELNGLYDLILQLPQYMNKGARLSIISFHSLEDRIVKLAFNELTTNCICPPRIPICVCGHKAKAKHITRKPIIATEDELKINSRSKPAKLRVVEII